MKSVRHGEIPKWYDEYSNQESLFNDDSPNANLTNQTIEKILKKHKVKTVLDLTCGTGSQVFWLLKHGYEVIGSDISTGMLKLAKKKALNEKINAQFIKGDMRTIQVGNFDAAITIFNSIGHLTKADFAKTMRNINKNLSHGGIYIFDILNLNYVKQGDNILKMSYEMMKSVKNTTFRVIQHSILDKNGVLISYTTFYDQKINQNPKCSKTVVTLQLYTAKELKEMLTQNGFKVLSQSEMDGSRFSDKKSERILTVAKKIQ